MINVDENLEEEGCLSPEENNNFDLDRYKYKYNYKDENQKNFLWVI